MKLPCFTLVETVNGPPSSKRYSKSCLSIGKHSVKDKEVYLLFQQANKNKYGTKYKIKDNIEMMFTKYVSKGKTTIRFKQPAHDISIQSDPLQLKSFLQVLKIALSDNTNHIVINLSNLEPKKMNADFQSALKTKVVVKSAANYPVLEGFPRTTQELQLVGLERKSFDRHILKLQNLKILNLSNNQLTSLPQELGMLPHLQELHLANNLLGKNPKTKWTWMSGAMIVKNLLLLNLNSNHLTEVPYQVNKLHNLVCLFLNDNCISAIPHGIINLNLNYLEVARNRLKFLPGCLKKLMLSELDISSNPFLSVPDDSLVCSLKVPSLLDLAAREVKRQRFVYDASIIPFNLIEYLDKANYCMCGSPCFSCYMKKYRLGVFTVARKTKFCGIRSHLVLYEYYYCSVKCSRLYTSL